MTDPMTTTVTPLTTYRNDTPYPFCPGCGHGPILDHLNQALLLCHLDPHKVVIVSDIGCSGLSDQYFATNAFHGLHGRSITYASGIKLARPDLEVIVIMGDGGTGIGGAHLINAARRNIGITVLVMNNFNFGMTGGQHSTTTPAGAFTATTPGGNLERPLDICATVAVNGAGYVYRGTSFDVDLPERIAASIDKPGFGLLDIWELCTAHYVPRNKASKRTLATTLDQLGFAAGLIQEKDLPEYAAAYRKASAPEEGKALLTPAVLEPFCRATLEQPFRIVVAGSAGGRVRAAARLLGQAAILANLHATQRDDYPITIKTGHSVAETVLSPKEIRYTGISRPDALVIVTEDGLGKSRRYLSAMMPDDRVFTTPEFKNVKTDAQVTVIDPTEAGIRIKPGNASLFLLASAVGQSGFLPLQAFESAAGRGRGDHVEENLGTIRAGWGVGLSPGC